jgi:hypothetical protein
VILRVRLVVGEVHAKPPSHVGDGVAETMLIVVRCQSRVNLAVALCRYQPMLVTALPSPAGDDVAKSTLAMTRCRCRAMLVTMTLSSQHWSCHDVTAEMTWSWHNVTAESCRRWCCQGELATTRYRCRVTVARRCRGDLVVARRCC